MPARLVFAGTPAFALASLRGLVAAGRSPVAVLTRPDRPAGRGRKLRAGPVKQYAEQLGIPVLQPETLGDADAVARIREFSPDALIVAAYGLLLPRAVLDLPPSGSLNVHASLLPRWRGAAPVQAAILAGDRETGISLMQMEEGLDSGGVYAQQALTIGAAETAGELTERLATLGAELLQAKLDDILGGRLQARPQDVQQVTCAAKPGRDDPRLDWTLPARTLCRRVRAFNPVPGAWFEFAGERVKCWSAEPADATGETPGQVLGVSKSGIDIACGEASLRVLELQRPGRGRVSAREFADQTALGGRPNVTLS